MTYLDLSGGDRTATAAPAGAAEHHNQHVHDSVYTLAWQANHIGTATHSTARESAKRCDSRFAAIC